MVTTVRRMASSRAFSAQSSIGFIGLGTMGQPMALNVASEHASLRKKLLIHDQDSNAVESLALSWPTTRAATDGLDSFAECSTVLLCLPDGDTVTEVIGSLIDVLQRDTLVIDCSTTPPDTSKALARALHAVDCHFIDAPVTGEASRARAGTLTVIVGGSDENFARALPFLDSVAGSVVHMGPIGSGQLTKALNNALYNVSCAAMGEALCTFPIPESLSPQGP